MPSNYGARTVKTRTKGRSFRKKRDLPQPGNRLDRKKARRLKEERRFAEIPARGLTLPGTVGEHIAESRFR